MCEDISIFFLHNCLNLVSIVKVCYNFLLERAQALDYTWSTSWVQKCSVPFSLFFASCTTADSSLLVFLSVLSYYSSSSPTRVRVRGHLSPHREFISPRRDCNSPHSGYDIPHSGFTSHMKAAKDHTVAAAACIGASGARMADAIAHTPHFENAGTPHEKR